MSKKHGITFKKNKTGGKNSPKKTDAQNAKKKKNFVVASVEATTGTPAQKKWALIAYIFTMICFLIPIVYLIIKIVFGSFDTIGAGFNSESSRAQIQV